MSAISHEVRIETKIGKVCDKGSLRYALGHVHVRSRSKGGAWLTASDGRILAVVKSEGSKATGQALLPCDLTTGATKNGTLTATLNGRWETSKGKFGAPGVGRFPQCEKIVQTADLNGTFLRIDAKLLGQLGEALTDSGAETNVLTLIIGPDRDEMGYASRQVNVVGRHGIGVIMPVAGDRKTEDEAKHFTDTAASYVKDCQSEPWTTIGVV